MFVTTKPFQVSVNFISVCCKLIEWETWDRESACVCECVHIPGLVPLVHFMFCFIVAFHCFTINSGLLFVSFFLFEFSYFFFSFSFLCITFKNSFMSSFSFVNICISIILSLYIIIQYASLFHLWFFFLSLSLLQMIFSLCTFDDEEKT